MDSFAHAPVMSTEVVAALNPRADSILVDATFGRGGHTRALLNRLGPTGQMFVLDRDPVACAFARKWAAGEPRMTVIQAPFSKLFEALETHGIAGRVGGLVLDLGVSSPQLDDPARGFSFMRDGPLDMRMDPDTGIPVSEWLAQVDEQELVSILRNLGEERFAKRIARAVVEARAQRPLSTTHELAELVSDSVPYREPGKHPATRTFQALRIHVNRELEELESVLPQALEVLEPGGRLVVISFHSLEDRRVKNFLRDAARGDPFPPDLPIRSVDLRPAIGVLHRPQWPSAEEISLNPRARSAVLRSAQKQEEAAR